MGIPTPTVEPSGNPETCTGRARGGGGVGLFDGDADVLVETEDEPPEVAAGELLVEPLFELLLVQAASRANPVIRTATTRAVGTDFEETTPPR